MVQVRLGRYEAEDDDLPRVCMRCAAAADSFKDKNFSWHPPWLWLLIPVGVLPAAIVAMILTKWMRVQVPLCRQHRNHWTWRTLFLVGSLVVLVAAGIGAGIATSELARQPGFRDLGGYLCLGILVLGLFWLIAVGVLQHTAIRPVEITDRSITLTNVSQAFADALDDYREERRAARDAAGPRRRRRDYIEDEEEDEDDYDRGPRR